MTNFSCAPPQGIVKIIFLRVCKEFEKRVLLGRTWGTKNW